MPIVATEDTPTIQAAIDAAQGGEEVIVPPGTYQEQLTFRGVDITLRSVDPGDLSVVEATIITGLDCGSTIRMGGTETEDCLITGLTITGDARTEAEGYTAGIDGAGSRVTIRGNIFRDLRMRAYAYVPTYLSYAVRGGAIAGSAGRIEGNFFLHNRVVDALDEGYVGTYPPNEMVVYAGAYGGGLYECSGPVLNNVFYDNGAEFTEPYPYSTPRDSFGEGAIMRCTGPVVGNTLYGNAIGINKCPGPILDDIVWDCAFRTVVASGDPDYCCIQDYAANGTTNINFHPGFVDAANGDFRLSDGSPCIDAGAIFDELTVDIEGVVRPRIVLSDPGGDGSGFDIGAYEFPGEARLPAAWISKKILGMVPQLNGADLNADGFVDIGDWILHLRDATP